MDLFGHLKTSINNENGKSNSSGSSAGKIMSSGTWFIICNACRKLVSPYKIENGDFIIDGIRFRMQ